MVTFRIECELVFPRREFWLLRASRGFLDFVVEDGMLKKMQAEQVRDEGGGWWQREFVYIPSKIDVSPIVRAVIGDGIFEVHDTQRWSPERPFRLYFKTHPTILSGLVTTNGETELFEIGDTGSSIGGASSGDDTSEDGTEQDVKANRGSNLEGENDHPKSASSGPAAACQDPDIHEKVPVSERCIHVISGEVRVALFSVGWFVEKAIVHNLKVFYRDYPKTVARFRQKLVNEYADGDVTVPISKVVKRYLIAEEEREERRTGGDQQRDIKLISNDQHNKIITKVLCNEQEYSSDFGSLESDIEDEDEDDAVQNLEDANLIDP